jgi:hypothetical protein
VPHYPEDLEKVLGERGLSMRDFWVMCITVYVTELALKLEADNEEVAFRVARFLGLGGGDLDMIWCGVAAMSQLVKEPMYATLSPVDKVHVLARRIKSRILLSDKDKDKDKGGDKDNNSPGPEIYAVALPLAWYSRRKHHQYDVSKLLDLTESDTEQKTKRISDVLYVLPPKLAVLAYGGNFEAALSKQAKKINKGINEEPEIGFALQFDSFEKRLSELDEDMILRAVSSLHLNEANGDNDDNDNLLESMKRGTPQFIMGQPLSPHLPGKSICEITFERLIV